MTINSKSVLNIEALQQRKSYECPLEIQLYNDFDNQSPKDLYDMTTAICQDVTVVHTPIKPKGMGNLECMENIKCRTDLIKTLEYAGRLSVYYEHEVIVVVHLGEAYRILETREYLFTLLDEVFYNAFAQYPLLRVGIENVMCEAPDIMKAGVLFDNVRLVERLNCSCGTNRFGTVLDICHAKATCLLMRKAFAGYETICDIPTLETFFEQNEHCCILVHLADAKGLGISKGEHGCKFGNEDDMRRVMELYHRYEYKCPITIEISEIDYTNVPDFTDNFLMLKKIEGLL